MEIKLMNEQQQQYLRQIGDHVEAIAAILLLFEANTSGQHVLVKLREAMMWAQDMIANYGLAKQDEASADAPLKSTENTLELGNAALQ